jgi:enamine deaminase RidA (YjgF/YER057c/UK114 family)
VGDKGNDRGNEVVVRDGNVYIAGQFAEDGSTTVAAQTRAILDQIDARLAAMGTDRSMVASATVYLADAGSFQEMDAVWSEWLPDDAPVVRVTVESRLSAAGSLVEIGVTALVY